MKVELKGMSKNFGKQAIFDNFDLAIESGEMVAVTGKSGSGKTTLINMLGLIEKMDSGTIYYDDKPVEKERQKRKLLSEKIGFVFQNFGLIDNETVYDNLALVKSLQHKKAGLKRSLISQALENVGLNDGFASKKVFECSGGEQQRIAIAKLLLKDCGVVRQKIAVLDPSLYIRHGLGVEDAVISPPSSNNTQTSHLLAFGPHIQKFQSQTSWRHFFPARRKHPGRQGNNLRFLCPK